jgi:hypothetical protein
MTLLRLLRRRVSLALVLSLLFAQWATASYICPRAAPTAGAAAMSTMADCAGMTPAAMDPEQPQLCKAHCEQGTQSVNATPQPLPATLFTLWAVLDWHVVPRPGTPAAAGALKADRHAPSPPGQPPIYLTLRVLRD